MIEEVNARYAAGAAVVAAVIFAVALLAPRRNPNAMSLSVRWGREKLRVPVPTPESNLASLRALLAEQTALPQDSFKLVHAGAVMKDDNAPLSAYGLRHGSKIAIIDGAANAPTGPAVKEVKSKTKPETEDATIAVIRDELEAVQQRIVPALDTFLATIAPPPPPQPSPTSSAPDPAPEDVPASSTTTTTQPATRTSAPTRQSSIPPSTGAAPDIEMEHRRLGEELLQALLRLDVLNMDGAWTSARTERKSAVKTVQALLDRLDSGWRARKERLVSQEQE